MMQLESVSQAHPPGHGPDSDRFIHSSVVLLVIPSNTACDMCDFTYTCCIHVGCGDGGFEGVDDALLNHGLLQAIANN